MSLRAFWPSLFTQVPVRLYSLAISLQGTLTAGITGFGSTSIGDAAKAALADLENLESLTESTYPLRGFGRETSGLMVLFCLVLMAYAVIKVFFANLKRGGILLIQIAVGSLYMFSVPRGVWRRIHPVVQAGHRPVSHGVFAGHHPCGRADGVQRPRPAGLGAHALCRGNSPHRWGLWAGHHHEGQSYLGGLHSSERRQYCPDGGGQMRCITMGSLFDGIGGFPLAARHNSVLPYGPARSSRFPFASHSSGCRGCCIMEILRSWMGPCCRRWISSAAAARVRIVRSRSESRIIWRPLWPFYGAGQAGKGDAKCRQITRPGRYPYSAPIYGMGKCAGSLLQRRAEGRGLPHRPGRDRPN